MAIERMVMMNLVVPIDNVFKLLKELYLTGRVEFTDARRKVDETSFLLSAQEGNVEQIRELNEVAPFRVDDHVDLRVQLLREMEQKSGIKAELDLDYLKTTERYFATDVEIEALDREVSAMLEPLRRLEQERDDLALYRDLAENGMDFPIGKLSQMKHFDMHIGWVDQLASERLSKSGSELAPFFLKLGRKKDRVLVLFIWPKELETESRRVLNSLRIEEIPLKEPYRDIEKPEDLEKLVEENARAIEKARGGVSAWLAENKKQLDACYSQLVLDDELRKTLPLIGRTRHYAYLSLWTPRQESERIRQLVEESGGKLSLLSSAEARVYEQPPTSMKNNAFVRPFESLITMYGTPAYGSVDPTSFFAVAYMLLFGLMFGDFGQGLVFLLIGLLMGRRGSSLGGVLSRMGLASMIAGFFYDSFFGYEGLIAKLVPLSIFFHPFENTNTVLIAAVALGVALLSAAYVLGIVNKLRMKDYQEAFLGKEGLAGFVLFIGFILLVLQIVGKAVLPKPWPALLLIVSALLIFLRVPLYRGFTRKHGLYEGKATDYYVENVFNLVETFLGALSNSLSFIRVGAFALNHVGLFLAFHTLAKILNSGAGNVVMGLLGNLLIMVLEGLIVFIQDLRLMYYELFSKYFIGDGREFKPAVLKEV